MYEISKDYLNRLLEKSGVKLGSAKASAMASLIEILDANSLDGLIASIKEDFEAMKEATKNLDRLQQEEQRCRERIRQLEHSEGSLRTQINKLNATIATLKEEESSARLEVELRGCMEEERSRLIAYEAAIRVGKAAFDGHIPSEAMSQILRSASNVAAGFVPTGKPTEEEPLSPTRADRYRKNVL